MKSIAIFDNPIDYPGMIVARVFTCDGDAIPEHEFFVGECLDGARNWAIETLANYGQAATCFPRDPADEKQIVEVWL